MTAMTEETWADELPALPLDTNVPFRVLDIDGTLTGRQHRAAHCKGESVVTLSNDIYALAFTRLDLDDIQGFRYGLSLLALSVANEDRAKRQWPSAWKTCQALWQDYYVLCGAVSDTQRVALVRALAEVFDG